ncbi:MAG: hypothetical protein RLZZ292_413 [Bacteroidota bacterium]|jgi:hypothetical protein
MTLKTKFSYVVAFSFLFFLGITACKKDPVVTPPVITPPSEKANRDKFVGKYIVQDFGCDVNPFKKDQVVIVSAGSSDDEIIFSDLNLHGTVTGKTYKMKTFTETNPTAPKWEGDGTLQGDTLLKIHVAFRFLDGTGTGDCYSDLKRQK